jgi:hypothetical protein
MLRGRDLALALNAAGFRRHQRSHQRRVLAQRLEVAASLRHPDHVHHRAEDHILIPGPAVPAQHLPIALGQIGAERRRQRHRRRHRGCRQVHPHPSRTVGERQRRNTQPRHARNKPNTDHAIGLRRR